MRYIMANRLRGLQTSQAAERADQAVQASLQSLGSGVTLVGQSISTSRRRRTMVLEAQPGRIEALARTLPPEVTFEPEIIFEKAEVTPFDLLRSPPLDLVRLFREAPMTASAAGRGGSVEITAVGQAEPPEPLHGAEVHLFLAGRNGLSSRQVGRTDDQGCVQFEFGSFFFVRAILVVPYSGFWPRLHRGNVNRQQRIVCDPLPSNGPAGWWHEAMRVSPKADNGSGTNDQRMKVGVIDSGFGPHSGFGQDVVIDCGAFINGNHQTDAGHDSGSHGTHVSGIIASGGRAARQPFWGVASGVNLYSARVFGEDPGANQGDIANALDHLIEQSGVHIVNMSFGSPVNSAILYDAILDAYDRGCICVCASGNDGGEISYPARFNETIAVGAIGLAGQVPITSLPALPTNPDLFGDGNLHIADFSNYGRAVDCCAGGVGIISTVPERFGYDQPYAAMNGTSMASPNACGALAVMLSKDEAYWRMPPDRDRSRYVKQLLTARCRSIGLDPMYQGRGVPRVDERNVQQVE